MEISVGGGSAPEFTLKGSRILTSFKVYATAPGDIANKPGALLWQIEPMRGDSRATLDEIQKIRFGVIPPGFIQLIPQNGAPDIFAERVTYVAVISTAGAPDMKMPVAIWNGKTKIVGPVTERRNIPTH